MENLPETYAREYFITGEQLFSLMLAAVFIGWILHELFRHL
jgi:hypothetical protein